MNKHDIITALGLDHHFEGGYFRETFRSTHREKFATPHGARSTMTSIYYMLTDDSPVDVFHTKHSDGIQYYQMGAPITYHLIHPTGEYEVVVVGPDLAHGHKLCLAVTGGTWKAAELTGGEYGLVSEVVSPGWELDDMVLATRGQLLQLFPQHEAPVTRLTRTDEVRN